MPNTRDGWDGIKVFLYPNRICGDGECSNGTISINPLASGIKCADKVTTVSPSYLEELKYMSNGLEALFEYEKGKCVGILNGIDSNVWDPGDRSLH